MLGVSRYAKDYVGACRAQVAAQLASDRKMVRMLCAGIIESNGRMSADRTIRYKPETSILKFEPGDEIRLNADDFARLSAAFFDEIEKRYS